MKYAIEILKKQIERQEYFIAVAKQQGYLGAVLDYKKKIAALKRAIKILEKE